MKITLLSTTLILVMTAQVYGAGQFSTTSTSAPTTTEGGCPADSILPVFTGPIVSADELEFYFQCQVDFTTHTYRSSLEYKLMFLFDGTASGAETSVNAASDSAILLDTEIQGQLGKSISCRLTITFGGSACDAFTSADDHYADIYIDPSSLPVSLPIDTEMELPVISTLPILCQRAGDTCWLEFYMHSSFVESGTECKLEIHPASYVNHPDHSASTASKILLRAVDDHFAKADPFLTTVQFTDFFLAQDSSYYNGISQYFTSTASAFTGYQLSPLSVSITGDTRPTRSCTSTGPAHVTTFDGTEYLQWGTGDYYAMKSTDPNYVFEVQVRQWSCLGFFGSGVACNCAVVVREGNMVVGIDVCRSRVNRPSIYIIRYLRDGTDGAHVELIHSYRAAIKMPSGLQVDVLLHVWYGSIWGLGLYMYAPANVFQNTEGLCGSYNDIPGDDLFAQGATIVDETHTTFPANFISSYGVSGQQSIFNGKVFCADTPQSTGPYCECEVAGSGYSSQCANLDMRLGMYRTPWVCTDTSAKRRRKRAIGMVTEDLLGDNAIDPTDPELFNEVTPTVGEAVTPDWSSPAPDGGARTYTEAQVVQACADGIAAVPGYADCVADVNVDTLEEECKLDCYLSDSLTPIDQTKEKFSTLCAAAKEQAITLTDDNPGTVDAALAGVTALAAATCVQDCNSQGTCTEGACVCDAEWVGDACELSASAVPEFTNLTRNFCSRPTYDCQTVTLTEGSDIYNNENLVCRIIGQNIVEKTCATVDVRTTATYNSLTSVTCALPALSDFALEGSQSTFQALEFSVSVSNDGVNFGPPLAHVVYDEACIECNTTEDPDAAACAIKTGRCLITGFCYADGTKRPEYPECGSCDSTEDQTAWTPAGTANRPPIVTSLLMDSTFQQSTDDPLVIEWSDPDEDVITAVVEVTSSALEADGPLTSTGGTFVWDTTYPGKGDLLISLADTSSNTFVLRLDFQIVECAFASCNCSYGVVYPTEGVLPP